MVLRFFGGQRQEFDIDQSYLPDVVKDCSAIMQQYPIRGQQNRGGA